MTDSKHPLRGLLVAQFFGAFNDNAWKLIVALLGINVVAQQVGGSGLAFEAASQAQTMIAFVIFIVLMFVRPGGSVYVNSANGLELKVMERLVELGVGVFSVDAYACTQELHASAMVNLIMLGFAAAHSGFGLSVDELKTAVRALGPARAVELNLKALEMGAAKA